MSKKRSGPERGATPAEIAKIVALRDQHSLTFQLIGARLGIHPKTCGVLYTAAKREAA